MKKTLFSMLVLCITQPALAEKKAGQVEEEVQIIEAVDCANGKDQRRLEAQTKGAGCALLYTKYGKTELIGQARRGVELCREKLKSVRSNLERGGHKCQ